MPLNLDSPEFTNWVPKQQLTPKKPKKMRAEYFEMVLFKQRLAKVLDSFWYRKWYAEKVVELLHSRN